jgi:hypothetical protein
MLNSSVVKNLICSVRLSGEKVSSKFKAAFKPEFKYVINNLSIYMYHLRNPFNTPCCRDVGHGGLGGSEWPPTC